jgi:uncharacterized protein (DUF697 family)/uncharacterized tellurite resistance protein B-like protein
MAVMTDEALASIRLMICMAKADGVLKSDEKYELEDILAGISLPAGLNVEKLLREQNEPGDLIPLIKSHEARDYCYIGVYSIAYCDRELAGTEEKLLQKLRDAWGIKKDEELDLKRALDTHKLGEHPGGAIEQAAVNDAELKKAFDRLLSRYSILTALTGAIPVPLVPDLLVVPMQVKMVYDIAGLFGQKTDKQTVQLMFETLGAGTGARLGLSALCKLVPGWGSVVGATTSFATTWALGKVAYAFFKSEGKASFESLKPMFRQERELGKQEYVKRKAALDEAQQAHAGKLRQLAFDVQAGKLTLEEYEGKIDQIG